MIDILNPEIIGAFLSGIAGPMALQIYQSYKERQKEQKRDVIGETMEKNLQINNKIEETRKQFKADRVFIHQFHNGGHFYPTGKSMQKFSMVYETVGEDTDSIQQNFQNLPITLFMKVISYIYKNGLWILYDYENDRELYNWEISQLKNITKSKSSYEFAIKSIDGRFIGIIGLQYCKEKIILSSEEISRVVIETSSIGSLLIDTLHNK